MKDDNLLFRLNGGALILAVVAGLGVVSGVAGLLSEKRAGIMLLLCGAGAGALAYMMTGIATHHIRDSKRAEEDAPSCGRCFKAFPAAQLQSLNVGYALLWRIGWTASSNSEARYCPRCARILNWSIAGWALLVVGLAFTWGR